MSQKISITVADLSNSQNDTVVNVEAEPGTPIRVILEEAKVTVESGQEVALDGENVDLETTVDESGLVSVSSPASAG